MMLTHRCDECEATATVQRGLEDLCELHDHYKTAAHTLTEPELLALARSSEALIVQAARAELDRRATDDGCISYDEAQVDQRCGLIARHVLGFDSRSSNGPALRAVDPIALHAALLLAYRAGKAAR
jgi:hypothetical protein